MLYKACYRILYSVMYMYMKGLQTMQREGVRDATAQVFSLNGSKGRIWSHRGPTHTVKHGPTSQYVYLHGFLNGLVYLQEKSAL